MIFDRRSQLIDSLRDKEYRDLFVTEQIATGLAFQIREMREARGLTQRQFGAIAGGMLQEQVSLLEDPDYGSYTLKTLKRIASAMDVALIVRFAPFSELVEWILHLSPEVLAPPDFEHDPGLHESTLSEEEILQILIERSVPPGSTETQPVGGGTTQAKILRFPDGEEATVEPYVIASGDTR